MEKKLQSIVDKFNHAHPIGSKVQLKTSDGIKEVTVSEKATVLYGHSAVGWFKEFSGCYSLSFVI